MIPEEIKSPPIKLIIPMAGKSERLHSFMEIAGKSIIHHIVKNATDIIENPPEEISFILGKDTLHYQEALSDIADQFGATVKFYEQEAPLGTANAIHCASESLSGQVMIVFADTLFESSFQLKGGKFNVIWVKKVEEPEKFGVVKLNEQDEIINFVEKPKEFVSNLALIGAYFMSDASLLKEELNVFMQEGKEKASLTDVLRALMEKQTYFEPAVSKRWYDCESLKDLLRANRYYLSKIDRADAIHNEATIDASIVKSAVHIGKGASLKNVVVGPDVSIADGVVLENVIISNAIVQSNAQIKNHCLENSIIGRNYKAEGSVTEAHWLSPNEGQ